VIILYRHGGKVRTGEYRIRGLSTSGFRKNLGENTGNYVGENPGETETSGFSSLSGVFTAYT